MSAGRSGLHMDNDELLHCAFLALSRADGALDGDDDDLVVAASAGVESMLAAIAQRRLLIGSEPRLDAPRLDMAFACLTWRQDRLRRRLADRYRLS